MFAWNVHCLVNYLSDGDEIDVLSRRMYTVDEIKKKYIDFTQLYGSPLGKIYM